MIRRETTQPLLPDDMDPDLMPKRLQAHDAPTLDDGVDTDQVQALEAKSPAIEGVKHSQAQHTKHRPTAEPVRLGPGAEGTVGYLAKMFPRISESFILNEALALRKHGVDIRLYSILPPTRDKRMHEEAKALLPEVYVVPELAWSNAGVFAAALFRCWRRRPRQTRLAVQRFVMGGPQKKRLKRLFRSVLLADRMHQDRVAHLHAAWAHTPASVGGLSSKINGTPWAMSGHAKDIYLSKPESIKKKLTQARYTTTCTKANVTYLNELGNNGDPLLPQPAVDLYYHGVDCSYFCCGGHHHESETGQHGQEVAETKKLLPEPSSKQAACPIVLCVGRLVPKKGHDILIEAAALLRDRGVSFKIELIGEGPLREEIQAMVSDRGLEDHVSLLGMMIRSEVKEAYDRCACVTLASRITEDGDRDGVPNTLAEAMAAGRPVVSTAMAGIRELVIDQQTGLLVEPNDPEALADALERVLVDADFCETLGLAGQARVHEVFDAERWGEKIAHRVARSLTVERVLYVSQDRGVPVRGSKGASVHLRSVVKSLKNDFGIDTQVLTTQAGPDDGPVPANATIHQVRADAGPWVDRAKRLAGWFKDQEVVLRELLRVLDSRRVRDRGKEIGRAWHADMVYERYALMATAGRRIARSLGVPHVLEVNAPLADEEQEHRGLHFKGWTRRAERKILCGADLVVVVSEPLADHARRLGVDPERILVLPNGVDPTLFHPKRDGQSIRQRLEIPDHAFTIGFCGQLKERYGLDGLLRAIDKQPPELKDKTHVVLIGGGKQQKHLSKLAKELGIADRVHLTGAVAHEAIGDYLAACDLLVAPYTHGGDGETGPFYFSSMKVAEYTAVGKPVLLSLPDNAIADCRDQSNVMLTKPDDVDDLAKAIGKLGADEALRERMTQAALDCEVHTWTHVVRAMLERTEQARRSIWKWPGFGLSPRSK